ncbi:MAG: vanadium nitrogenase [Eubacteriales bacterium]|nr:vanadium nitrogenase [Eubacteriales bacterium]
MAAILGAFVQYVVTGIYFTAIAALGIFAGKKLLKRKQEKMGAQGE